MVDGWVSRWMIFKNIHPNQSLLLKWLGIRIPLKHKYISKTNLGTEINRVGWAN